MATIKKADFQELYNIACKDWKSKFDEKFKSQLFGENLEFEDKFIAEMETACTKEQEQIFRKIFKKFLKEDIFSSINNYKELCLKLEEDELELSDFKFLPKESRTKVLNGAKIQQLERYFNKGWKPNWKDRNEAKWYPYFELKEGKWVLCCCYYVFWGGCGVAGLYQTEKIAKYIGTTQWCVDIYSEYLNS